MQHSYFLRLWFVCLLLVLFPGNAFASDLGRSVPWLTGAYGDEELDQASIDRWSHFAGRRMQVATVFTDRETWASVTGRTWAQTNYTDRNLILATAQPMWPNRVKGSLEECGSGGYDEYWKEWGRTLRVTPNPVITRLGWEFNGDWWPWSAHDPEAYIGCYRRIVAAVRAIFPSAKFEWNVNGGHSQTCDGNALNCYPGDDYVDVISIDYYDHWPASLTDADFEAKANAPGGITWLWNFAVARKKHFGVAEWGVVNTGHRESGGDNPVYVKNMQKWFRDHVDGTPDQWLYEAYFSVSMPGEVMSSLVSPNLNPKASSAYVKCENCGLRP